MPIAALLLPLFTAGQTIVTCPTWESDPGAFETGLIAVPTDRANDILDVFSASGNDAEAATVLGWSNRTRRGSGGPFSWTITDASWTSGDVGLHTDVVAGRFDDDDELDLVVLAMLGSPSDQAFDVSKYTRGAVGLYRGIDCNHVHHDSGRALVDACRNSRDTASGKAWSSFATTSTRVIDDVFGVTFGAGDANGDGRLDVGVPLVADDVLISMRDFETQPPGVPARVYWNAGGGRFDARPWTSSERIAATSAAFADVDGDGVVDVVFGADALYVHFGKDKGDHVELDREPGFIGAKPATYTTSAWMAAMSLDTGWLRKADGSRAYGVVAGWGCPTSLLNGSTCAAGVATYFPTKATTTTTTTSKKKTTTPTPPDWAAKPNTGVSHVKLAAVAGDGDVDDILSTAWIEADTSPGRLRMAKAAKTSGVPYQSDYYVSSDCFVGEAIVATDLNGRTVTPACASFQVKGDTSSKTPKDCRRVDLPAGARALTLPSVNVQRVTQVERGGAALSLREWNTVVGSSLVTLREPLKQGEAIAVRYGTATNTDIVVATWDPSRGIVYFPSFPSSTTSATATKGLATAPVKACACASPPTTAQQQKRGHRWH